MTCRYTVIQSRVVVFQLFAYPFPDRLHGASMPHRAKPPKSCETAGASSLRAKLFLREGPLEKLRLTVASRACTRLCHCRQKRGARPRRLVRRGESSECRGARSPIYFAGKNGILCCPLAFAAELSNRCWILYFLTMGIGSRIRDL